MAQSNRTNRIAVMAGLGLVIALIAGSASVSRWTRRSTPPAPPPPVARALPDLEAPAIPREEIERRRAVAARLRARIEEGRGKDSEGDLLPGAEPVPLYRDGVLVGVELRQVSPDGFYAELGFREGDRVRSLNGIRFDTPGLAGALTRSLLHSDRVEVELERSDGRPHRLSVPSDRVFDALEAKESPEPDADDPAV